MKAIYLMRALRAAMVGVVRHSTSSREVSRSKRSCRRAGLQNRDTPLGCLHEVINYHSSAGRYVCMVDAEEFIS